MFIFLCLCMCAWEGERESNCSSSGFFFVCVCVYVCVFSFSFCSFRKGIVSTFVYDPLHSTGTQTWATVRVRQWFPHTVRIDWPAFHKGAPCVVSWISRPVLGVCSMVKRIWRSVLGQLVLSKLAHSPHWQQAWPVPDLPCIELIRGGYIMHPSPHTVIFVCFVKIGCLFICVPATVIACCDHFVTFLCCCC